jgi:ferrochelatase
MSRQHVVLVTYGEPPAPFFIEQLVYSWRILIGLTRTVAPIPPVAIPAIALARGYGRRRLWREHEYSSPLESLTDAQAIALRHALRVSSNSDEWSVRVAYEFRRPLLPEVIAEIPPGDAVWVAPMYAADSTFTHELSRRAVAAAVGRRARPAPVRVLPPIAPDHLADISARHVLASAGAGRVGPSTALVLAAHGTLIEPARPIETGRVETERLCEAIRSRLSSSFGLVVNGWLNHTRGGEWTAPAIDESLRCVRDAGYTQVVYYPYGFLADNAESQLEGRMALAAEPLLNAFFVPCLNDSAALARLIAQQIHSSARGHIVDLSARPA